MIRNVCRFLGIAVVLICVAVVFNAIGKGAFDLTDDESFFFAIAATIVATFLYRRHAFKATLASTPSMIDRALSIAILVVLLTIPSRIRAVEDSVPDISSIEDGISSLQSEIEELKNQIDSIETSIAYR